jgi:hypothetical protein
LHACVHNFCNIFTLLPPLPSNWCHHSSLGRTCSSLPLSDFAEEKREKEKHVSLQLVAYCQINLKINSSNARHISCCIEVFFTFWRKQKGFFSFQIYVYMWERNIRILYTQRTKFKMAIDMIDFV